MKSRSEMRAEKFWVQFEPDRHAWAERQITGPASQLAALGDRLWNSLRRRHREHLTARAIAAGHVAIGRYSYGNPEVVNYHGNEATVTIGDFASIADEVRFILGGGHYVRRTSQYPSYMFDPAQPYEATVTKGSINVGSDVWLARDVTVLSGVTIGHGAAVAAGSMVSRDVRPYALVAGNPAREIRRRFSDSEIASLLRIAWWEWPVERIAEHSNLLFGAPPDELIRMFDPDVAP